ncbi:MAG TPA: YncE family protein [Terracidiphilus sp.]|nr:YncE family protein [Terracidiphilus sp.]
MRFESACYRLAMPLTFAFLFASFATVSALAADPHYPAAPADGASPAGSQPYSVIYRWQIGGDGGWDYVTADGPAHRLYIARSNRVEVVDTTTGKLVGEIGGMHRTHGIALDPAGKYGYISDGDGNAVILFDRSTLATVETIPGGNGPDGIIFEPATNTVWAFDGHGHTATVIDAATHEVVATVPLPGKPEAPAVDGKGTVYDNLEDKNEVIRIDARSKTITATWPAGCESPSGLGIDAGGQHLFPVCDGNKMSVIDTNTGKVVANPSIGDGPDAAGFSDAHNLAFATSGDGILSVVDASAPGYPTIESLSTQQGARTMAYDTTTDRVYTVTAQFGPRPAPSADNPRPRPPVLPGSFTVIVIGRQ